jgi:hypothetical protein
MSIPVVMDCPSETDGRALNEERVAEDLASVELLEDLIEVELLEMLVLVGGVDEDVTKDGEVKPDVDERNVDKFEEGVRSSLGS